MDQPGKVTNPDCGQLNRGNEYLTCMTNLHVLIYAVYAEQMCIHTTVPFSVCVGYRMSRLTRDRATELL